MNPIYLDYNATTPIDKEVAEAMLPYLYGHFGNPSSNHVYGMEANKAVAKARKQIAGLLHCKPREIVFTSGGTESNNFAIKGAAFANRDLGNHIITSSIEHPAVIEVCKYLEKKGFEITGLPVDGFGRVNPDDVKNALKPETILISIMHANNETGSIQPIGEISKIAQENNILFHCDAAQSIGKIPVDVHEMGVDLLSVAGHKLYAPKGIGALYIKEGTKLEKLIHGADHEMNMRAGTENVLEIVGLGKACEIADRDLLENAAHYKEMRDLLFEKLKSGVQDIHVNGHPEKRLPNTLSLGFANIEANSLLLEMKGVAASAGAACHTDSAGASSVLRAMNVPGKYAMGTIRFSMGRGTNEQDIEQAAREIIAAVENLKTKGV
ncbi:MAG: cysteine desulfurase [Chlorobi bacterium]|nr:cysteine desulfurase [Chlorobiota bacterium]